MQKSTIWLFLGLVLVYLALVCCAETNRPYHNNKAVASIETGSETARRRHSLYKHAWGWHALAIAYWIKVKLVIVAFFVGSAIFVGLRYYWPHKCHGEIYRESPPIYDHGPSFVHDHIPYSSDHSSHGFDTSGPSGPYSSYSGIYSDTSGPPSDSDTHHIKRRSTMDSIKHVRRQFPNHHQPMPTEEQIGEIMFYFLGLDSMPCRRRFICEMEFRSRLHPMTSMAFRIVGQGFFGKYTNARNTLGHATSFADCASVNFECVFIEGDEEQQATQEEKKTSQEDTETSPSETADTADNELTSEVGDAVEKQNVLNLRVEQRRLNVRGNRPGQRQVGLTII